MTNKKLKLIQETDQATELLKGKVVKAIVRHREKEVLIEFEDGTRLYIDHNPDGLELSITGK